MAETPTRATSNAIYQHPAIDIPVPKNPAMTRVFGDIEIYAKDPSVKTLLLLGESGSGKEICAEHFHSCSPRNDRPMVRVDAGALPESLLESELFGHAKGSYTGALYERRGLLKAAAGGILFLDEIGKTSLAVQSRLLRVLETGEFRRVGSDSAENTDAVIIMAMNEDPEKLIREGKMLPDFFYRIGTFNLRIPPLRERPEDIVTLAEFFLNDYAKKSGKPDLIGFSELVIQALQSYAWPGNVRELRNVIHKSVVLARAGETVIDSLPFEVDTRICRVNSARGESQTGVMLPPPSEGDPLPDYNLYMHQAERELLTAALARNQGVVSQAARQLNLSRSTLEGRLHSVGLKPPKKNKKSEFR
jgi:two-component system, NtrC family, response regulator HydG